MREIRRAENSGFCFGVKRALMKTEEQIDFLKFQVNEIDEAQIKITLSCKKQGIDF